MKPSKPAKKYARNEPWILVGVFFLAILQTFCLVQANVDSQLVFSAYMFGDSDHYLTYAQSILAHGLHEASPPFHPPLTAFFLSAVLILANGSPPSILSIKLLLSLSFVLVSLLTAMIAGRKGGPLATAIAGVLTATSFGLAVVGSVPASEMLYLFWLLLSVWVIIRRETLSISLFLCLGVVSGLAWLTRGEHLLLIPVLAAVAAMKLTGERSFIYRLLLATVFCGVSLLTVSPWTVRNYRVMTQINRTIETDTRDCLHPLPDFVPVTLYGPLNFALANLPPSEGTFSREALPKVQGSSRLDFHDTVHRRFISDGYQMGFQALLNDRLRTRRLMIRKIDLMTRGLSNGFTVLNLPGGLAGIRQPIDLFTPRIKWFRWIVLLWFSGGILWLFRHEQHLAVLISVLIIHRFIVTLLFYGYARHGILLWPLWAIVAGITTSKLVCHGPTRRWLKRGVVAAVCLSVLINLWTVMNPPELQVDYTTDPATGRVDQQQVMKIR